MRWVRLGAAAALTRADRKCVRVCVSVVCSHTTTSRTSTRRSSPRRCVFGGVCKAPHVRHCAIPVPFYISEYTLPTKPGCPILTYPRDLALSALSWPIFVGTVRAHICTSRRMIPHACISSRLRSHAPMAMGQSRKTPKAAGSSMRRSTPLTHAGISPPDRRRCLLSLVFATRRSNRSNSVGPPRQRHALAGRQKRWVRQMLQTPGAGHH